MAKIKKRGTTGAVKNYITRTQAVRKLQLSLPDFRRLCIFKGIYPREPRHKRRAAKNSTPNTTFYYTRDIQYLLHEPLLAKFREHKALAKKIGRALGRNEVSDAARMEKNLTPKMSLDHVIKERYPTFVDALRDLDDCLSMLFLFANLPQSDTVPPKTIQLCQRLCLEFEHYLIRTNSLKKSFLSIKGIYYQATIQGQDILWLVPYKFVQRVTGDVDFRIMGTFVEFYTTLLGFVNYRLYNSIGLVYPPKFSQKSDEQGAELGAFTLEGRGLGNEQMAIDSEPAEEKQISATAQAEADKILAESATEAPAEETTTAEAQEDGEAEANADTELDAFPAPIDPTSDTLIQPSISASTAAHLFDSFTFFLSRETPRHPLEFLVRAFGCKRVGWDAVLGDGAYTSDEADRRITHQIVDRPNLPLPEIPTETEEEGEQRQNRRLRPGERVPGRIYVQPQWVWDCINAGRLLRTDLYAPGATLPPHLSPWVKPKKGEYDPTKSLEEQEEEGEAELAAEQEDEESDEADEGSEGEEVAGVRGDEEARKREKELIKKGGKEVVDEGAEGMDVELAGSDDESEEEDEEDEEFGGFEEEEESDEEDDDAKAAQQHQRELEAEARGASISSPANKLDGPGSTPGKALKGKQSELQKKLNKKKREEEEEIERQKMMMSRRKRKVFEKMQYSNNKRDAEAEKLRGKRRKLEKGQQ
ncbi:mRNA-binding ribosome synthesis protein nop7 [Zalaria obscura]|uniref:mRNA-binding ribosome synthesis protein nop7 n=1 Tax=Zalaria obscura TaxID=2024903 RepID=A0ACC3S553_9PEZI